MFSPQGAECLQKGRQKILTLSIFTSLPLNKFLCKIIIKLKGQETAKKIVKLIKKELTH